MRNKIKKWFGGFALILGGLLAFAATAQAAPNPTFSNYAGSSGQYTLLVKETQYSVGGGAWVNTAQTACANYVTAHGWTNPQGVASCETTSAGSSCSGYCSGGCWWTGSGGFTWVNCNATTAGYCPPGTSSQLPYSQNGIYHPCGCYAPQCANPATYMNKANNACYNTATCPAPYVLGPNGYRGATCVCPSGYADTGTTCQLICPAEQISVNGKCVATLTGDSPLAKNLGVPFSGESAVCPADTPGDFVGNPVNQVSGNKYQVETDFVGEGPFPLELRRYYNSLTAAITDASGAPRGNLGYNWRHSYERLLVFKPDQINTGSPAYAQRPDGQTLVFSSVSGIFTAESGHPEQLVKQTQGSSYVFLLTLPRGIIETYDNTGRLTSITRQGFAQTLQYNGNGQLATVTDPSGRTLQFAYDGTSPSATVDKVTLPDGGVIDYTHDASARLTTVKYPDNTTRTYTYAASSGARMYALAGLTDEAGTPYASWTYTDYNKATSSQHVGSVQTYTLNYGTGITTVTDPRGTARTVNSAAINGTLLSTSVTSPDGGTREYDGQGLSTAVTDAVGGRIEVTHDSQGLETSRTVGAGTANSLTVTTEWDATHLLPTAIQTPALRTVFAYDAAGRVTSKQEISRQTQATRTWTYTYNAAGLLSTVNGPRTDVQDLTSYGYTASGVLQTVTNALGHVTTVLTWDAVGRPLQVQDPNGAVTTYAYDLRGRLTSIAVAGSVTTMTYLPTGLLATVTNPDGVIATYTYDAAQRLTRITDSRGGYTDFSLDNAGTVTATEVRDAGGVLQRSQSFVYDTLGRLHQIMGAQSQTTELSYDNAGHLTSKLDARGHTTTYTYDALGRVTNVLDALQGSITLAHDSNGDLSSITTPNTAHTHYTYNGFGDVTSVVSPDSGTTTYTYDSAGNRVSKTDARGITTSYAYDALNRVTQISYPDSTRNASFTYDQGTNGLGRLSSVTDPSGTRAFSYDSKGRITSESWSHNSQQQVVAYSWTLGNALAGMTYPSGRTVSYTRDNNDRITTVATNGMTVLSSRTYRADGLVTGQSWGNGLSESKSYDLDGQMTSWTVGGLLIRTYAYDANGNVIQKDAAHFQYDELDRLTAEPSQIFLYDANGNRLSDAVGVYSYGSASNRMATNPAGAVLLDAAGNTLQSGSRAFTYDNTGRLASAVIGPTTVTYTYRFDGLRSSKTVNGIKTYYLYDLAGRLIAEVAASSATQKEYVWDGMVPAAQIDAGGVTFLHADALGTPRLGSNSAGAQAWSWDSNAFGSMQPTGTATVNLRFPGQYYDSETGTFYNYFRDYDPQTGRYVQSDPIGLDGGINTYSYVGGNPLTWIDPRGLDNPGMGSYGPYWPSTPTPRFGPVLNYATIQNAGYALASIHPPHSCPGYVGTRGPDFVNFQVDAYVFSTWGTFSRDGNSFVGGGLGRAYPNPLSVGASVSVGWLNTSSVAAGQTNNFLSGFAGGATAVYAGVGGGVMYSPGNGTATVVGVGAGASYGSSNIAGGGLGAGASFNQGTTGISW